MRSEQTIIFPPGYLVTSITFGRKNSRLFPVGFALVCSKEFSFKKKIKINVFSKHRKKGELLFLIEKNKLIWYSLAFVTMLILLLFTARIVLCLELTLIIPNRKSSRFGKSQERLGEGNDNRSIYRATF